MPHPHRRVPSLVEQAAALLREGFQSGRWVDLLPGVVPLAEELMVSKDIARAALKELEKEGWIEDCGAGRRRRIVPQRNATPVRRTLRIGVMLYASLVNNDVQSATILLGVRHAIETAGHVCVFSEQCLAQMKDNLSRISRCVKTVNADAWIVYSGSRVVLEWFAAQPFPVYALGGQFQNLSVASSSMRIAPAIESAVNALVDHGHQRIVMLIATIFREPTRIPSLDRYLSILEARGIVPTQYNLPHFGGTAEDLENCLDGLFRITPPTALLVNQAHHYVAVSSFLARCGLRVPQDISVVCMSTDPVFSICLPPLDHFHAPGAKHINCITRWVNKVAKGRPDIRQTMFDAVYVPGGTVGPAKK